MTSYAIITPSFKEHFHFLRKYIESYNIYVEDKKNVSLVFTISKNEFSFLKKIINKYSNDIIFEILFFEDILDKFNIKENSDELLKKYGKFTYQSLKKLYTMLYVDYDYFLVLDSESMFIKKTNIKKLFENFFNSPFISGSSISKRKLISPFTQGVIDNIDFLLNKKTDKWFLENFIWFYDKNILIDMHNRHGFPLQMAESIIRLNDKQKLESGIFEVELYHSFIYINIHKYKYKFIDIDLLLNSFLSERDMTIYIKNHDEKFLGNCGLLEHSALLLNRSNYRALSNIFRKNLFNIIRCDISTLENIILQEKFIKFVSPNILAASQNHAFGINNRFKSLIFKNIYTNMIINLSYELLYNCKLIIRPLLIPIKIIKYSFLWFICTILNIKKYIFLEK